jgi:competence ComEA-like helix-hairpin-helix protein
MIQPTPTQASQDRSRRAARPPLRAGQWLTPADQRTILGLVAVGWIALAAWLAWSGWRKLEERGLRHGESRTAAEHRDGPRFQVEVNSAPWQEWTLLPGIGETTAKRIVEHRERVGGFARLDDLRRVRGIGPKTLERLRPYLWLEPSSRATSGFTDHARFGQGSLPWTSSSPANSSLPATSPKPSPL